MVLSVYEFVVRDTDTNTKHVFTAYRLPTGEVMVPQEGANDLFFCSLETVSPFAYDIGKYSHPVMESHKLLGAITVSEEQVNARIYGTARQYEIGWIPESLRHIVEKLLF